MDWLSGMNAMTQHIEENLDAEIVYEDLSKIVGCSVYEFSRIFSFMAEMSLSEYIRRRRLSQAVFDIQSSSEKIIDIAMKYGYESQATFTRAFKELHGTTPLSARKSGVSLKTYPPMSFALTIKGGAPLAFRIEKKETFKIFGVPLSADFDAEMPEPPSLWNTEFFPDSKQLGHQGLPQNPEDFDLDSFGLTNIVDLEDTKNKFKIGWKALDEEKNPMPILHMTAAFDFEAVDGKINGMFGFSLDAGVTEEPCGNAVKRTIPTAE